MRKLVEIRPLTVDVSGFPDLDLEAGEIVDIRLSPDTGLYKVIEVEEGKFVLVPEGTRFE